MGIWSDIWPWRRSTTRQATEVRSRSPSERQVADVRYAQRGSAAGDSEQPDRDAYVLELQEDLARLCRTPSPLMQRLHLYLSIVEAQTQIRIHRGTLPLTNEEFDQLLRAIRAVDDPEFADDALRLRKSLVESGYLTVPPRLTKGRRR